MKFVRALLLLIFINYVLTEERHCSKYDFMEKILEKIVRMEFNENQKQVDFERIKIGVTEKLDMIRSFSTNMKNVIDLKVDELDLKVDQTTAKVDETIALVTENTTKFLSALEQKFSILEKQIMDKLQTIQETTQTVAFKARINGNIGLTTGQSIVYPVVMFNIGNGYDSSTGVFTTPVNGTYMFDIAVCPYTSKYVNVAIVVDDEQTTSSTFYGNGGHTCFSANSVSILKSEQRVKIKVTYASSGAKISNNRNSWNTFSGVLI